MNKWRDGDKKVAAEELIEYINDSEEKDIVSTGYDLFGALEMLGIDKRLRMEEVKKIAIKIYNGEECNHPYLRDISKSMVVDFNECLDCGKLFMVGNLGVDLETNDGKYGHRCIRCNSENTDFAEEEDKYKLKNAYEYAIMP